MRSMFRGFSPSKNFLRWPSMMGPPAGRRTPRRAHAARAVTLEAFVGLDLDREAGHAAGIGLEERAHGFVLGVDRHGIGDFASAAQPGARRGLIAGDRPLRALPHQTNPGNLQLVIPFRRRQSGGPGPRGGERGAHSHSHHAETFSAVHALLCIASRAECQGLALAREKQRPFLSASEGCDAERREGGSR